MGQSSPVIWGSRIFLTAAKPDGNERVVFCVDRNTGKIEWQQTVWKGAPEPSHRMNGFASSTCVTDGERVYAFFGRGGGLFCLTTDGKLLWEKPLGNLTGPWGTAACPVLVGDLVIQNCDSDEEAFLVAFDKTTGQQAWKVDRENFRGWSTPILIEAAGREELVLQGHTGVRAYDALTGKQLWYQTGTKGRGTPTVTPGHGLLYVIPGRPGTSFALKPGGSGNVSDSHVVWKVTRKGRDLPSPIVVGDYVLMISMRSAILTCYSAKDGKQLWQERIGGNFTSSPVSYDGMAVFLSESGEALVVKPGPTANIVSRSSIGATDEEIFRASITPSKKELFMRSTSVLYCVGK
jgi:outer membrane protein assembly factor BamB